VSSRVSLCPARLAVAIVGLIIVVSCSGNTTSPSPVPTTVPPETPSSTPLLWPLAGRDGRDWVINNYVDLDSTSGTLDYTGGSGSGAKTYDGHTGIDIDVPSFRWMDGNVSNVLAAASVSSSVYATPNPIGTRAARVVRTSCRSVIPMVVRPFTVI
jgi:hypothetical protein